jgi:hypothetical protein
MEIERILKKAFGDEPRVSQSAHDFLGLISQNDIELMEKAIAEGCEQIHTAQSMQNHG